MKKAMPPKRNTATPTYGAKVADNKDICKVIDYFRYNVGTTLDCAKATSVLRNSITWYVHDLQSSNMLDVVFVGADSTTSHKAKHYGAKCSTLKARGYGED